MSVLHSWLVRKILAIILARGWRRFSRNPGARAMGPITALTGASHSLNSREYCSRCAIARRRDLSARPKRRSPPNTALTARHQSNLSSREAIQPLADPPESRLPYFRELHRSLRAHRKPARSPVAELRRLQFPSGLE